MIQGLVSLATGEDSPFGLQTAAFLLCHQRAHIKNEQGPCCLFLRGHKLHHESPTLMMQTYSTHQTLSH